MTPIAFSRRQRSAPTTRCSRSLGLIVMTKDSVPIESVHGVEPDPDMRLILVALSLIFVFLIIEVVAAIVGDSLVLYADAGHMVTDVVKPLVSSVGNSPRPKTGSRGVDVRL